MIWRDLGSTITGAPTCSSRQRRCFAKQHPGVMMGLALDLGLSLFASAAHADHGMDVLNVARGIEQHAGLFRCGHAAFARAKCHGDYPSKKSMRNSARPDVNWVLC
jgi:hypothetical protein